MIRVVAIVTTKPGRREEVLAAARAIVPGVLAEKGCREYQLVVDDADFGSIQAKLGPDVYAVIETWESAAALRAHGAAAHLSAFREKVRDLIVRSVVHVLTPA